ncbi:MAG: ZIP family metal transporter [Bacteroidetes bacterium]|nr:ZIP family metal transporter [Bacteroidota bacterium]
MDWLQSLNPVSQALIAGLFTWSVTAVGAAVVVFVGKMSRAVLDTILGFAAGVMIAASFWSLLLPAISMAEAQGVPTWIPASVGFLMGGLFLRLADKFLPHLHPGFPKTDAEGVKTKWEKATLLVLAITLHNIPEGLAVGVAFGAVAVHLDTGTGTTFGGAVALALGIGLQNFPEGIAVALPLRCAGVSRLRSFWYGQLSAVVEPVAAVFGAAAVMAMAPILPYALAFAAGAMIYVVVEELIPESQCHGNEDIATMGALGGFTVMMILDITLG